jgi:hypothetical protein
MIVNYILFKKITALMCGILLFSCSESENSTKIEDVAASLTENTKGSGSFDYTAYAPLAAKPVKVFYHIPASSNGDSPILFLFHGDNRNGAEYRDVLVQKAEKNNFIVIAPEFSEKFFPTGDTYNLGNVFVDGDNPTAASLNPENIWTFSVIEPLFNYVKTTMKLKATSYSIIGHSAGAQFAHRLIMFKPNSSFNTAVISASGWYTLPDFKLDFPYGLKSSPLEKISLSLLYSKKVIVQIGLKDNDPNYPGLRRNALADAQGIERLARANFYFNCHKDVAALNKLNFEWKFVSVPNLDHDYVPAVNAASDLIFK